MRIDVLIRLLNQHRKNNESRVKNDTGVLILQRPQDLKGIFRSRSPLLKKKLQKLRSLNHKETTGIGSEALPVLVDNMLKYQTIGVDSVAGATVSSAGLKTAVKDALTQAGADLDKFSAAPVKGELKEETLNADVVVIGGGAAGMSLRSIRLKKDIKWYWWKKRRWSAARAPMAGGSLTATNSQWQKEAGYEDSSEMLKERLLEAGHNKNHLPSVELFTSFIGPNFDWIVSEEGGNMPYIHEGSGSSYSFEGGGAGVMLKLKENLLNAGAEVLLNTQATELIVNEGAVVGIKAKGDEANYTINAKAVILASGGYGHNRDIVPEEYFAFRYSGHSGHDGDALEMIKAVDGATRNLTC